MIKDYDLTIQYHPSKANVVADTLSRKETPSTLGCLIADFDRMEISYCYAGTAPVETQLLLELAIPEQVRKVQQHDRLLQQVRKRLDEGKKRGLYP